jgi:hypothetical protein
MELKFVYENESISVRIWAKGLPIAGGGIISKNKLISVRFY